MQKELFTTSTPIPFSQFVQHEIKEKGNFDWVDLSDIERVNELTDQSLVIWVTDKIEVAASYLMDAESREDVINKVHANEKVTGIDISQVDKYIIGQGCALILDDEYKIAFDDGDFGMLIALNGEV